MAFHENSLDGTRDTAEKAFCSAFEVPLILDPAK